MPVIFNRKPEKGTPQVFTSSKPNVPQYGQKLAHSYSIHSHTVHTTDEPKDNNQKTTIKKFSSEIFENLKIVFFFEIVAECRSCFAYVPL